MDELEPHGRDKLKADYLSQVNMITGHTKSWASPPGR